ncbi:MAG: methyltransferase domain-containing protein [Peptococcaceae bacterium]
MKEKIGNVTLDYTIYLGKDLYSDGKIEDELLNIVQHGADYMESVSKKNSWPLFYHLSQERHNLLQWYNMTPNATVLEIGAGCGALTGCLVEKNLKVTCVELSKKRSLINAYRNKNFPLEIIVGNFQDFSATWGNRIFDYITLIGVFEYAENYMYGKTNPYAFFLQQLQKHLKNEGKLIIAIENKFGLKYWAGCKEDHTGRYFEGIEGYVQNSKVKTFSKKEWQELLFNNGFKNIEFYYPYPDYKFPIAIYSDEYLPKQGELQANTINYDNERFVLFDETSVFDNLLENELFPEFSNSFLIIAER